MSKSTPGANKFYSYATNTNTGAYVLTEYTIPSGTTSVLINKGATATGIKNLLKVDSVTVDMADAEIIDTTTNDISTIGDLNDAISAHTVKVSVVYDSNNGEAAYIYVASVT